MVGITSYGAYIPRYRMDRRLIFEQLGWFNPGTAGVARGEKAVANYDEDTITMAHAAATDCLKGKRREMIDGLYLASISLPFAQRQNAVIVSDALDFTANVRIADFTGSLRSGTTALLSASEAVKSGNSETMMVCASDCRVGKPGSTQEHTFGDGAAALLVGNKEVIAELKGFYSVSYDFIDYRRLTSERFLRTWEERWIREEGYGKIIPEIVEGLLSKCKVSINDFAKIIIPCPIEAWLRGIAKSLGVKNEQLQNNMQANVGDTGTALPLMMLVSALEEAKAGDKILVLGFGSGGDALYFEVTEEIEKVKDRKGVKGHLERKKNIESYTKYIVFRNLIPVEMGIRGETIRPTAMTVLWQQGRTVSALEGVKCKVCGTPQYPRHIVCVNPDCGAVGQMEPYCFSDKTGKVVSFTGDNLVFCWDPPAIYGLVDFEEGGRLCLEFTDCAIDAVKVGMPVEMTFRKKYSDEERGHYGYYWKAMPVA